MHGCIAVIKARCAWYIISGAIEAHCVTDHTSNKGYCPLIFYVLAPLTVINKSTLAVRVYSWHSSTLLAFWHTDITITGQTAGVKLAVDHSLGPLE